jgi:hypothetical protein
MRGDSQYLTTIDPSAGRAVGSGAAIGWLNLIPSRLQQSRERTIVVNPKVELQRVAGKFAFFFAGCYLLVLFGAAVTTVNGDPIPVLGWLLLLLPAAAFVPSVLDAVKLHRSADTAALSQLWWRTLAFAAVGLALLVAAAVLVERITPV